MPSHMKRNAILKEGRQEKIGSKRLHALWKRRENRTQPLLRACDKIFNNAANGDTEGIKAFLQEKGLPSSMPRWVGNRFNIMFQNASILFLIGDGILEYFLSLFFLSLPLSLLFQFAIFSVSIFKYCFFFYILHICILYYTVWFCILYKIVLRWL